MNIAIETRTTLTVYGIRHCGPYNEIYKAFDELWCWALAEGLDSRTSCAIAVYYDNPNVKLPSQLRSDACLQLDGPLADEQMSELIQPIELLGGCYAKYRHVGPYEALEPVYQQFYQEWLPQSDYLRADMPSFEVYLNNPRTTAAEELVTEVYFPVVLK